MWSLIKISTGVQRLVYVWARARSALATEAISFQLFLNECSIVFLRFDTLYLNKHTIRCYESCQSSYCILSNPSEHTPGICQKRQFHIHLVKQALHPWHRYSYPQSFPQPSLDPLLPPSQDVYLLPATLHPSPLPFRPIPAL